MPLSGHLGHSPDIFSLYIDIFSLHMDIFSLYMDISCLYIDTPPQGRRKGWRQPYAQRMKMIDRPMSMPQIETRPYACFDVTDSQLHRVRYVFSPIGRLGEGDAAGDCCYNGSQSIFRKRNGP